MSPLDMPLQHFEYLKLFVLEIQLQLPCVRVLQFGTHENGSRLVGVAHNVMWLFIILFFIIIGSSIL